MESSVLERAETVGVARRTVTVLDQPGLTHDYDPTSATDVAVARAEFADLVQRGYFCYREEGGGGGTILRDFEPDADVTYVPRMVGG